MTENIGKRLTNAIRIGGRWGKPLTELLERADDLEAGYQMEINNLERIVTNNTRIKRGYEVPIYLSPTAKAHREKRLDHLKTKVDGLKNAKTVRQPGRTTFR